MSFNCSNWLRISSTGLQKPSIGKGDSRFGNERQKGKGKCKDKGRSSFCGNDKQKGSGDGSGDGKGYFDSNGESSESMCSAIIWEPFAVGWMPSGWMVPGRL